MVIGGLDGPPDWDAAALSESERLLLQAFVRGELVERDGPDPFREGASPDDWGADVQVRAAVVVWLLSGAIPGQPGHTAKVQLSGVRVTGRLNLNGARVGADLLLSRCWIDDDLDLAQAKVRSVKVRGCQLKSVAASQIDVDGQLDLSGSRLTSLNVSGARVAGLIDLSDTRLDNPDGTAFQGENLDAAQNIAGTGMQALGEVSLSGANIGGALVLDGARLTNPGGLALVGYRLTVARGLSCTQGFRALGEISLISAVVGGGITFTGARLENPGGWALNAQGVDVGYALFIGSSLDDDRGFYASGGIRLNGATIGGFICAWDAELDSPAGIAFAASGMKVGQDVLFDRAFTATGEVHMSNARIGTVLALDGARLDNPGRVALTAERLVADSIRVGSGFQCRGTVNFSGATVAGGVDFAGAALEDAENARLILTALQAGSLTLRLTTSPQVVDLQYAKVGTFDDDPSTWPTALRLRGFVYDALEDHDRRIARRRLRWIRRDPDGYLPQPYEQLAAVLRGRGQEDAARTVSVARRSRQRAATRNPWRKAWNWFLYLTVGYGYRTFQAVLWLGALLAVGSFVFDHECRMGQITANSSHAPGFYGTAYTLDVLVPVLDLGQQSAWQPHGAAQTWSWVMISLGWLLTTVVVAAITGLLKRD